MLAHQARLETRAVAVAAAVEQADRAGQRPEPKFPGATGRPSGRGILRTVTLQLPWPWAGEDWVLSGLGSLNYITGSLGSGKTRLAKCLAHAIPNASFVGLDRLVDGASAPRQQVTADASLASRVEHAMAALVGDGATASAALQALLVALCAAPPRVTVVDMVEQDLDDATQRALMRLLRGRGGEPLLVYPRQGGPGVEAVDTCLASPAVRARTAGVIACQECPAAAGHIGWHDQFMADDAAPGASNPERPALATAPLIGRASRDLERRHQHRDRRDIMTVDFEAEVRSLQHPAVWSRATGPALEALSPPARRERHVRTRRENTSDQAKTSI